MLSLEPARTPSLCQEHHEAGFSYESHSASSLAWDSITSLGRESSTALRGLVSTDLAEGRRLKELRDISVKVTSTLRGGPLGELAVT